MISVIIPTLNEEKALPVTLHHILVQPGDYEVIGVDGTLIAAVRSPMENHSSPVAPKSRAAQDEQGSQGDGRRVAPVSSCGYTLTARGPATA